MVEEVDATVFGTAAAGGTGVQTGRAVKTSLDLVVDGD